MKKVMLVFGTRPEAVKMAPLIGALRKSLKLQAVSVTTAQHRAMLDQVTHLFGIEPDFDLQVMQERQDLASVTARALERLTPVIAEVQPSMVVVQGDTTTSFVGALASFYCRVPVAHVEAGLRTFDRYSPFPEEVNRRLTTQLTSLHLAPTATSRANLLAEGVSRDAVVVTGNTVIDALLQTVNREIEIKDPAIKALQQDPRDVLLVTAHRRESWGKQMSEVGRALRSIARQEPQLLIVLPLHRNPIVRESLVPQLSGLENVLLVESQPYATFAWLMARAKILLTDSGGVQEEGPSLGKPVLVMRDTTERPEAVDAGTVRLIGTVGKRIVSEVQRLLHEPSAYSRMANAVNPYGDGVAAERSVAAIASFLGLGPPATEFAPRIGIAGEGNGRGLGRLGGFSESYLDTK
jgi:UDP-N-acetylglucosamine 2-epimerase (non-hydrolysing)